jgi:hypothetical protein
MSRLYTKSRQEAKTIKNKAKNIQQEAQKKADNTEWERKVAERKMKNHFEWKFNEFTRALQTMLSDDRMERSVHSIAQSVLAPKEGDTKPVEQGVCLQYTISDGIAIWIKEAVTPEPSGNGDGARGSKGDRPVDFVSSSSSSRSSRTSDSADLPLPQLQPPAGMDYSVSPLLPSQVPP